MFRNLEAEQARKGLTDEEVSKEIGVTRSTYVSKKRNGSFKAKECYKLCVLFNCNFEYLFMAEKTA